MPTSNLISTILSLRPLFILSRPDSHSSPSFSLKPDGTKVTPLDLQVNEILQSFLSSNYPTYGIVSEELDHEWREYTWFIDPLNGTNAYLEGKDAFNVLVGLAKGNTPVLGIIYHPVTDKLYIGGVDEKPRVIYGGIETPLVKADSTPGNLLFCPSQNWENVFKELFRNEASYTLVHGNALGSEFKDPRIDLIEGKFNLQINSNFGKWGTWDICAGHAILSCFGGVMSDYYGNEIDYGKPMLEKGFIAADNKARIEKLPWIRN